MNDRNIYIQKCILDAVYEELDKRNIPREDCLKFLFSNTIIKESRLKAILSGTNKRPITLRELTGFAIAFDLNTGYLLRNINKSKEKKTLY